MATNCDASSVDTDSSDEEISSTDGEDPFDAEYENGKVYLFPNIIEPKSTSRLKKCEDGDFNEVQEETKNQAIERRAADCEWRELKNLKEALEDMTKRNDLPAFILANAYLRQKGQQEKAEGKTNTQRDSEKDVVVFHRRLGALILEVKAVQNERSKDRFQKAASQLLHGQTVLLQRLEGLMREDAVFMAIALPNIQPERADFIRDNAGKSSDLKRHPEIELICSGDAQRYKAWLENILQRWSATCDPYVAAATGASAGAASGSSATCIACATTCATAAATVGVHDQEEAGDRNFKKAVGNFCCVPRYGQAVKLHAKELGKWILTKDQMTIKNADDRFVHIYGPPRAGKSLLIIDRARRWLSEGEHVAVLVGRAFRDTLLAQLAREVLRGELYQARDRLVTCRNAWELWEKANQLDKEKKQLFVVIDELGSYGREFVCRAVCLLKEEGLVHSVWSTDAEDYPEEWYSEAAKAGIQVRREYLPESLRCSEYVVDVLNVLCSPPHQPTVRRHPMPVSRTFATEPEVIAPPDHAPAASYTECSTCTAAATAVLLSLGLLDTGLRQADPLEWRDCIILHTGRYVSPDKLATVVQWLRTIGVPAEYEADMGWENRFAPVSQPAEVPSQQMEDVGNEESEESGIGRLFPDSAASDSAAPSESLVERVSAWRQRVLTGKSKDGSNVVHLMDSGDFLGLERPVVFLVHQDDRDDGAGHQSASSLQARAAQHRRWWYNAVSRCQGKLIVLALTRSPALHLLTRGCGTASPLPGQSQD